MITRQPLCLGLLHSTPRAAMTVLLKNRAPFRRRMATLAVLNASAASVLVCLAFVAVFGFPLLALLIERIAVSFSINSPIRSFLGNVRFLPFAYPLTSSKSRRLVGSIFLSPSGFVFISILFEAFQDGGARLLGIPRAIGSLTSGFRRTDFWRNDTWHGEFSQKGRCAGRLSVGALAGHLNLDNPRLAVN